MSQQSVIQQPATTPISDALFAQLRTTSIFSSLKDEELRCLNGLEEIRLQKGDILVRQGEIAHNFWVLLEGNMLLSQTMPDGREMEVTSIPHGNAFGELPLLANIPNAVNLRAEGFCHLVQINEEGFWSLMTTCPDVRKAILGNMAKRFQKMQSATIQQEKMASLGTLAAGLMHELNNPGAAARRAASQLRSNLQRMHELARGFSERGHTAEQRACLTALQDRVLAVKSESCLSSLQQSDAEEMLGEWLDGHHVAKAWEFAPVLVGSGIQPNDLECLSEVFAANELAQPIEWLEASASSMQMVGLVEDSVARVVELAQAVKSYAHEGQGGVQDVDVNESIHATIVMLKHKLREKNISMTKEFAAGMPKLHCICSGLNQVWTNLLDNAIDAVPATGGSIYVRTSMHGDEVQVAFEDNGSGISKEDQERIFDPFFTTKAAGVGSGMGLGIVRKILESYDGWLTLTSESGRTEFVVHLPKDQRA